MANEAPPTILPVPTIAEVSDLARAASEHVRKGFEQGAKRIDGRGHLVTEADLASEAHVLAWIRHTYPSHVVMAEETASASPPRPALGSAAVPTWIVDPLDGTRNFVAGLPHFAVSIAFGMREANAFRPLRAAIVHPITGEIYTASKGEGAWVNGQALDLAGPRAAGRRTMKEGALAVAIGRVGGVRGAARLATAAARWRREVGVIRVSGSAALDLAAAARGVFAAAFGHGLAPWDVAAGILLVTEAGGVVVGPRGEPFDALGDSAYLAGDKAAIAALVSR